MLQSCALALRQPPRISTFFCLPHLCAQALASACDSPQWLFVGLGNPGQKFDGTRHNVGFEMIDAVSKAEGIQLNTLRHDAIVGEGTIAGVPVLLAKPQTYSNLSGESVGPLAEYHGLPAQRIVAIFDDMESKVAKLWLRAKGGHGSHKGLVSMIKHLKGSRDFPRLRIGIGPPPGKMDPKAFVLQKFCKEERDMMDIALIRGVHIIKLVATTGVERAVEATSTQRISGREENINLV